MRAEPDGAFRAAGSPDPLVVSLSWPARGSRIGALLFACCGLGSLAAGTWEAIRTAHLLRHGQAAIGHVMARPGNAGSMSGAHPLIGFTTQDGRTVRFNQNGMGSRRLGTPIPLLFDPADPAGTATAEGFWWLWFPILGPFLFGLPFAIMPFAGTEIGPRGGR